MKNGYLLAAVEAARTMPGLLRMLTTLELAHTSKNEEKFLTIADVRGKLAAHEVEAIDLLTLVAVLNAPPRMPARQAVIQDFVYHLLRVDSAQYEYLCYFPLWQPVHVAAYRAALRSGDYQRQLDIVTEAIAALPKGGKIHGAAKTSRA